MTYHPKNIGQITHWKPATWPIETTRGKMKMLPYGEWCQREAKSIGGHVETNLFNNVLHVAIFEGVTVRAPVELAPAPLSWPAHRAENPYRHAK